MDQRAGHPPEWGLRLSDGHTGLIKEVILITGASSGFGALTARALARAGHIVYASMLNTANLNAAEVGAVNRFAIEHEVDLRAIELDVTSQTSVRAAITMVIEEQGRIDIVIQNAGHMAFGPAEAFTPEQFADLYDINVLGTQRVNRAVLPYMRGQRRMSRQHQYAWRDTTLSRAIFCRKGRYGFTGRELCRGVVPLGH